MSLLAYPALYVYSAVIVMVYCKLSIILSESGCQSQMEKYDLMNNGVRKPCLSFACVNTFM